MAVILIWHIGGLHETIKIKTTIFLQESNNGVISLPGAHAQSQKSCPSLTAKELQWANDSVSNCNVKSTDRQNYNSYSAEERAQIGKYAAENGLTRALKVMALDTALYFKQMDQSRLHMHEVRTEHTCIAILTTIDHALYA